MKYDINYYDFLYKDGKVEDAKSTPGWGYGISHHTQDDEDLIIKCKMKTLNNAFDTKYGPALCSVENGNTFTNLADFSAVLLEDAFTRIRSWGLNPITVLIPGVTSSGLDLDKWFVLTDAPDGFCWSYKYDDRYGYECHVSCKNPKALFGGQVPR